MDKIAPSAYITDIDPDDESIIDSSGWYESQTLILEDADQLQWLLAQGWVLVSMLSEYNSTTERWEAYRWSLSRRVLRPEYALNDLITSFTNAYNEGRTINDQRYDELVSLYSAVVDKTEDELNVLETDDTAWEALVEALITNIGTDESTHNTDVAGDLDDYGTSERNRIDTQFDALSAQHQASLIARGLYNTTVWTAASAGIERERAIADADIEDKILDKQMALKDRLYVLKTEMRSRILAARDRLRTVLHDSDVARVGMRNEILKTLFAFMERREDGYPDIGSIGNLAASLGAGNVAYPAP
jgi:hypothetical protein